MSYKKKFALWKSGLLFTDATIWHSRTTTNVEKKDVFCISPLTILDTFNTWLVFLNIRSGFSSQLFEFKEI